ncbi:DUF488 domain-containing protein [uncultured Ferrovibrio sp.]|jgi:uncharacterized protein (DUF488 family)|uniref:DUF488 domain-containing protein n=1 Tax=uncultured Ferrovibrio sp. TaxID=1576913 RepID=UPI002638EE10|nr:DUF488 domain-containing protein [uncultured Ferrovibrio sp.]
MTGVIFTIGHSNHPAERFLALLNQHGIRQLADIRSQPASRFTPHFNRQTLAALLGKCGIAYRWMGEALGGRPRDRQAYDAVGHVDYAKLAALPIFQAGVAELISWAAEQPTAIMCAERDPRQCHRTHLVTPALLGCHVDVQHILVDGAVMPHAALQRPAEPQMDLFEDGLI